MAITIGEATAHAEKKVLLLEALQQALDNAPPPETPGTDIQNFQLLSVEFEFGGWAGSTRTRVTVNVEDGPMKNSPYAD